MRTRCPACGRTNEDADRCARCSCDLSDLRRIAEAAERELDLGSRALRQGRGREALARAEASWWLRKGPQAARLAFLASLLLHRPAEATHWWKMGSGLEF